MVADVCRSLKSTGSSVNLSFVLMLILNLGLRGAEHWQYLEGLRNSVLGTVSQGFPSRSGSRLPRAPCYQVQMGQEMKEKPKEMVGPRAWGTHVWEAWIKVLRKVGSGQIQNRKFLEWFLGTVGSFVLEGLGNVALERTGRFILWPNVTWKQHSAIAVLQKA